MQEERKSIEQCDDEADKKITYMIAGMVGCAVVPAAINWTILMTAMGAGVISIGNCYGFSITKEGGADLVKQFFLSAGTTWLMLNVGSKIFTAIIQMTGLGYVGGAAVDAIISAAQAYAVGGCAKAYFRKKYQGKSISKEELGKIFKEKFQEYKKKNQSH